MADLSVSDILRHPATAATSVTALLGGLLHLPLLEAVWASFYGSAGGLFGALAVLSFVAEHIPMLQTSWVIVPMVVVGGIVFYQRITDWVDSFRSNLDS